MSLRALKNADFSENGDQRLKVALVLGEPPYQKLVIRDLRALGFKVFTPSDDIFSSVSLGSPENTGALESASRLFERFAALPEVQEASIKIVHPGVSFWAERTELVPIAGQLGLAFVAPPPHVHRYFANRVNLLENSEKLKIPHLVICFEPLQSVREFEKWRNHRPVFPVVLKSTRPTRGIGVIVLHHQREVQSVLPLWLEQLQIDYRDSMVIVEKYKEGARKVALPFYCEQQGDQKKINFFLPIDRSLHSRTSAWVDVCPAPSLDPAVLKKLHGWTQQLVEEIDLFGFGQAEFLVDGPDAFLIDLSARLTDVYSLIQTANGVSIISLQLRALFDGSRKEAFPVYGSKKSGASQRNLSEGNRSNSVPVLSMAFRVLAEDVMLQMPAPGLLYARSEKTDYEFSGGWAKIFYAEEIQESSAADSRYPVSNSDGILAYGEVVVEESNALGQLGQRRKKFENSASEFSEEVGLSLWDQAKTVFSELWFYGTLRSSEGALYQLACHPWVRNGAFHSTFIDEEWVPEYEGIYSMTQIAGQACIEMLYALKVELVSKKIWVGSRSFSIALLRRLPSLSWNGFLKIVENKYVAGELNIPGFEKTARVALTLKMRDKNTDLTNAQEGTGSFRSQFEGQIQIGSYYFLVRVSPDQNKQPVVRALTTGVIKSLFFLPGQQVEPQETLVSLVSQHRLIQHRLPIAVRIGKWMVRPEQAVNMGDVLATIEWIEDAEQE